MKVFAKSCFSVLLVVCLSLAVVSCQQKSKTSYLPLPGGGGGSGVPGSGEVSATAVVLNGITEARNSYSSYSVAFNNAGYGLAVWSSNSGYLNHVVYALYDPATGAWSAPREFIEYANGFRAASNGTGFLVIFNNSGRVYARQWSGGSFAAVVKISGDGTGCNDPIVGTNGSGYCAVWYQFDTDRYNMYAAVFTGTSWSDPAQLDATGDSPSAYQVASNGSGYCVTWQEQAAPNRLFSSVYAGSSWSTGTAVDNGSYPNNYSVAGNASRYIIVFEVSSNQVYANVYNAGWEGASLLSGGSTAQLPSIASNGTTLCCVWHEYDGSKYSIYARTYINTLGWSAAETIDNATYESLYPRVASSGTGYCAVWQQSDGTSTKIYANRYAASWQGPELLNPLNTEHSYSPYIYANSTGYLAHWTEYASGEGRIGSSVYDSAAWSSMALIDAEYHNNSYLGAYPFTGGFGFSYGYSQPAGNGLMANVFRSGAWTGAVDVAGGNLHGACYVYNSPIVYRAGSATIAVWEQYDKADYGQYKLYASVKSGSTWGAPVCIGTYISDYYAASNGSALCVVWTTYDQTKNRNKLMGVIYGGGVWGSEALLDNDVDNHYSSNPRVAGNASSNDFCVAWIQSDGVSVNYLHSNFHTSSGWGAPSGRIDTGTGSPENVNVLAGDSNYCVIYNQDSRTQGVVYAGAWSSPAELDPGYMYNLGRYMMAASGDQFAVAFSRSSNVYVNVHDGSSWSGIEVQDMNQPSSAYNPAIAGDGNGGFCLAWYEYVANAEILTRIYDGSAWGDAMSASYFDEYLQAAPSFEPRVASNGTGYAVAYYTANDYSTYDLYANVYDGGTSSWLGAEGLEASILTVESGEYSIASNGTGYGVAWRQWSTDGVRMAYGSAFNGSAWEGAVLSNGAGDVDVPQLVGSGSSYTAAWLQIDAADGALKNLWSDVFD